MIREVKNKEHANKCDKLLNELIIDERKYNDLISEKDLVSEHFCNMIDDDNVVLLAYYDKEEIVGYILIRKIDDNICLLDGLYVIEEYRNKGIAKLLLNEAIEKCKNFNVKYVDINVMEKNEIAKHIYKELNFIEYEIKFRKRI